MLFIHILGKPRKIDQEYYQEERQLPWAWLKFNDSQHQRGFSLKGRANSVRYLLSKLANKYKDDGNMEMHDFYMLWEDKINRGDFVSGPIMPWKKYY